MKKETKASDEESEYYVEILGDTVSPRNVVLSILISIVLGLGGYLLGESFFPAIVEEGMVKSYSLLLGIVGCVIALVLSAILFRPKRILSEAQTDKENAKKLLQDLQVNTEEEYEVIKNDPVIKREMEDLKIIDIFVPEKKGE